MRVLQSFLFDILIWGGGGREILDMTKTFHMNISKIKLIQSYFLVYKNRDEFALQRKLSIIFVRLLSSLKTILASAIQGSREES